MVSSIIFLVVLAITVVLFYRSVNVIIQNIKLGKPLDIKDQQQKRWKTMFLVAIGQSKMVKRPIAGILHILVYTGFIMVNFEMLEIMTDGIAGTHRVFSFLPFYNVTVKKKLFSFAYLSISTFLYICALFFPVQTNALAIPIAPTVSNLSASKTILASFVWGLFSVLYL